ncbi:hypothetical protein [Neisseria lactamica]
MRGSLSAPLPPSEPPQAAKTNAAMPPSTNFSNIILSCKKCASAAF